MASFGYGRGFRSQRLSRTPAARERLLNAQSAVLEQELDSAGTPMIIGGQLVDSNNYEAVNRATSLRNTAQAEADAYAKMRRENGSPTLDAAALAPNRVGGAGTTNLNNPVTGQTPNGTGTGTGTPLRSAGNKPSAFMTAESPSDYIDTVYNDAMTVNGFRNGGGIGKQKTMKQPGYKGGGKVKMPTRARAYEEQVLLGDMSPEEFREISERTQYRRPQTQFDSGYDRDRRFDAMEGERVRAGMRSLMESAKPKTGYKGGGAVCKRKGMRGYAMGGQIGDEAQDDGKDTVDVRVREGEYLLNPETVAAFGGGDYNAGAEVLDGIVTATTGEEPGPVPVNEAGEEVTSGGMRMGFTRGGSFVEIDGVRVPYEPPIGAEDPNVRQAVENARARADAARAANANAASEAPRRVYNDTRFQGPTQPEGATKAPKAPRASGMRQAISGKHTTSLGDVVRGTGRGLARGARTVGGGTGLLRGTLPAAGIAGGWQGLNTPTEDYAERMGIDYPDTLAGELGVRTAGVLSDVGTAVIDPFIELGNWATGSDVPTLRSGFADVQNAGGTGASIPAQLAGAPTTEGAETPPGGEQPTAPAAPYGRAFGDSTALNLRHPDTLYSASMPVPEGDARIVQRTGGPGDEVIVREDVDGVPTFTNLRRGGFDGSPANLQAEADARATQDMAIRERNNAVVEQMRQSAPAYGDDAEARRQEAVQTRAAQLAAASKAGKTKQQDVDKRVEDRFQTPQYDEDGNIKGYVKDHGKMTAFYDAMAAIRQANPDFDLYGLSRADQNAVFDSFEDVYSDTIRAMRAAREQGLPVFDTPRTGDKSLRYIPDSNIGLGDVFGPEATLGDYFAGMFSDAPINDGFVEDPMSGARIPARKAVRGFRGGVSGDALARYGIPSE